MIKVKLISKKEIRINNIKGYIERKVTSFGTGAKVNCPKEYLGKKVYLVITEDR
jgi:putative transposon-encoded protein